MLLKIAFGKNLEINIGNEIDYIIFYTKCDSTKLLLLIFLVVIKIGYWSLCITQCKFVNIVWLLKRNPWQN